MGKLSYEERKALPSSAFAIPSKRKYPIPDESHARNALGRVGQKGTPLERKEVCRAVKRKFPEIHESHCSMGHRMRA
jgi:hypothetical protein